MVHALEHDEPASVVDNRDDAAPVISLGLRLGRRHYLARRLQAKHLLLQQ
jgi:hypothetical protein